jgi:hypothetical protein
LLPNAHCGSAKLCTTSRERSCRESGTDSGERYGRYAVFLHAVVLSTLLATLVTKTIPSLALCRQQRTLSDQGPMQSFIYLGRSNGGRNHCNALFMLFTLTSSLALSSCGLGEKQAMPSEGAQPRHNDILLMQSSKLVLQGTTYAYAQAACPGIPLCKSCEPTTSQIARCGGAWV